jgi:uncharacterized protein (TIRG00374 family)
LKSALSAEKQAQKMSRDTVPVTTSWQRRSLRWLPWIVAFGVLLILYRTVSLDAVIATIAQLTWEQLGVLFVANVVVLLVLNGRWWLILAAQGYRLPFLTLTGYRLAAFGLSYFTPGPHFGGEPLQVLLVERNHAVPRPVAVAAMTVDKALELIVNFFFLIAGVLIIVEVGLLAGNARVAATMLSLLLFVLPVVLIGALWRGRQPLSGLVGIGQAGVTRLSGSWGNKYSAMVQGLQHSEHEATLFLRDSAETFIYATLVSVLSWLLMLAEYWLLVAFLGIELTIVQLLVSYTAARIAFLMPLPGGLGTLDAGLALIFAALGLDPAIGLSASLVIHARNVILGGLGLWWGSRRLQVQS